MTNVYKELKLKVYPALEVGECIESTYQTADELLRAQENMANLLIFLQDDLRVMGDYSNAFIIEAKPADGGNWEEVMEEDLDEWTKETPDDE